MLGIKMTKTVLFVLSRCDYITAVMVILIIMYDYMITINKRYVYFSGIFAVRGTRGVLRAIICFCNFIIHSMCIFPFIY